MGVLARNGRGRAALGVARILVALAAVTLVAVRLGVPPSPLSASPAAIVYLAPDDPGHLRRVGYDGVQKAGSWALASTGGASHVVSVSPDGRYLVTLDLRRGFQIVDAGTGLVVVASHNLGNVFSDPIHNCVGVSSISNQIAASNNLVVCPFSVADDGF